MIHRLKRHMSKKMLAFSLILSLFYQNCLFEVRPHFSVNEASTVCWSTQSHCFYPQDFKADSISCLSTPSIEFYYLKNLRPLQPLPPYQYLQRGEFRILAGDFTSFVSLPWPQADLLISDSPLESLNYSLIAKLSPTWIMAAAKQKPETRVSGFEYLPLADFCVDFHDMFVQSKILKSRQKAF